jgi:LysM repeat protein
MAQSDGTVHAIAKGETLSGLAKKYHTTVGDIMRLNGMDSKSVLHIGQKVKIPSAPVKQNVNNQRNMTGTRPVASAPESSATPVEEPRVNETSATHMVGKKETLYGIGKKYNVTVDQIKEWNHLSGNNIHEGQHLIINGSAVISQDGVNPVNSQPATAEKQVTPAPVVSQSPVTSGNVSTPANNHPVIVENAEVPAASSAINSPSAKGETPADNPNPENTGETGYFASLYHPGHQELTGDAATFKTASGWLDKKYYVLVNNIDAGTIVRVTVNNKVVFAKVLGPLPDIKEDNGLLLRISNAAASSLGLADPRFPVLVNY